MGFSSISEELRAMRAELVETRQDTLIRMAKDKGDIKVGCVLADSLYMIAEQMSYPSLATSSPRKSRTGWVRRLVSKFKG